MENLTTEIEYPELNLKSIVGTNHKGLPTLQIWRLKSKARFPSPLLNYYYMKVEQRDEKLNNFIGRRMEILNEKAEQKKALSKARKEFKNPYKVGDIFYDSWGYEQTNVDFFQVIEVKKKSIVMQRISGKLTGDEGYGSMAGTVVAQKDTFSGDPVTKIIGVRIWNGKINLSISSRFGSFSKWDGQPVYSSWGY